MEENYRKALEEARKAVEGLERDGLESTLEAYWEFCCGLVLVAEENLREQRNAWENSKLVEEFMEVGNYLMEYEPMIHKLYQTTKRMVDCLFDHPRLKVRLLKFFQEVLYNIEQETGHDLSISEDVQEQLAELKHNIALADKGQLEEIRPSGFLKSDPVEWTALYEEVIDRVNYKVEEQLEDHPRGMGYCFAYWHAKADVLREYDIEWRSPSVLNPRVHFD